MTTPVITDLAPPYVVLGSPSFDLQVRGSEFEDGCVIVWNGADEPTTFVNAGLVMTGVNMETAAFVAAIPILVRNPGGEESQVALFSFVQGTPSSWPTIDALSLFTGQPPSPVLQWALDASVSYGMTVLAETSNGDGTTTVNEPNPSVFNGCLDYAASIYTQRISQADFFTSAEQGSTPQQRYRRLLLASRYVAIA